MISEELSEQRTCGGLGIDILLHLGPGQVVALDRFPLDSDWSGGQALGGWGRIVHVADCGVAPGVGRRRRVVLRAAIVIHGRIGPWIGRSMAHCWRRHGLRRHGSEGRGEDVKNKS